MNVDDRPYLEVNKFWFKFATMYPIGEKATVTQICAYYCWRMAYFGLLLFFFIQFILDIFTKETIDLMSVSENVTSMGMFFPSIFRALYYYCYTKKVKNAMDRMNDFFLFESVDGEVTETMRATNNFTRTLLKVWLTNCIIMTQFKVLQPLLFSGNERKLSFSAWYPWDWKVSPYYEITYFHQFLVNFLMVMPFVNADLLFCCCMVLTAKQFDILGRNFKNVHFNVLLQEGYTKQDVSTFFANTNEHDLTAKHQSNVIKQIYETTKRGDVMCKLETSLKKCIKHHQKLLRYCETLEDLFSPILLFTLFYGAYYITFIGFSVIMTGQTDLIQYFNSSLIEMFIITYSSQLLTSSTESLRSSMYEMPWYLWPEKYKSIYRIMQIGSSKSVTFTAGKLLHVSLQTFISLVRISFSYFTVLRQVSEENN